jgi:hypothetical protein
MKVDIDLIIGTIEAGIVHNEPLGFGPRVRVDGEDYTRSKDIPKLLRRIALSITPD